MERLEGVKKLRASFERREVSVEYDPKLVTVERLIATLESLGYRARVAASDGEGADP